MELLSNPEMLGRISSIASGMQNTSQAPATPVSQSENYSAQNTQTPNSRADVLLALKPLLKDEKRGKVDAVIKALTVASAISRLKGGKDNV